MGQHFCARNPQLGVVWCRNKELVVGQIEQKYVVQISAPAFSLECFLFEWWSGKKVFKDCSFIESVR